MLKILYLNK